MVDVHIHQITNEGVELSLSLFLAASSLAEEIRFREAVNCEILHQAAVLGVDLAPRHLQLLRQEASERSVIESAERQCSSSRFQVVQMKFGIAHHPLGNPHPPAHQLAVSMQVHASLNPVPPTLHPPGP
jgi:hypothetical protein